MSPILTLRIALRALSRNKLRTCLTMLGIIIGVAAVVAMLSIGAGAQAAVGQSLSDLGVNTVEVSPGFRRGRRRGTAGAERSVTVNDWKALKRLPEVKSSFPTISSNVELVYGSSNWSSSAMGTSPEYFEIVSWPVTKGRVFTESESNGGALVVVLGKKVARELFGGADPVGETVRLKGFPFRVVGVLKEKGGSAFRNRDDVVIIPYLVMISRIKGEDKLTSITLQAHSPEEVEKLQTASVEFLNQRYHITDKKNGFNAYNQDEASSVVEESTKVFSMLMGGVASVSLLVGGIGIMNIMLVSVTERVREIGIRMAVGARGRDILTQFLTEAILISLAGGAVGIALGAWLAHWLAGLAEWPFIISQDAVVLAFGTSAFIGIFFGFYPAYQASKLDPIEALTKK
jgi:putative ABC transport system permease protein